MHQNKNPTLSYTKKFTFLFLLVVSVNGIFSSHVNAVFVPFIADTNSREHRVIAAGLAHSIALRSDGTVWAWGNNEFGQLGDDTLLNRLTPVQVQGLTGVVAIAAGSSTSFALKSDGTVWAWGRNMSGELGDGTVTNRRVPVRVFGLTNVKALALGGGNQDHFLVFKSDGTVWAWGVNDFGQLGDGTTQRRGTPVQVSNLTGVSAVAVGFGYSVALKSDGTVWTWGLSNAGRLGDGSTSNRLIPAQVSGVNDVTEIAAGANGHVLVLKSDRTVWGWGYNGQGQVDTSTVIITGLVPVPVLNNITAISAGTAHSFALKSDGTVWAWGDGSLGQLGNGQFASPIIPSPPALVKGPSGSGFLTNVVVTSGSQHSLTVKSDGTVWAWGYNVRGELGDGTTIDKNLPVQVVAEFVDTTSPETTITSIIDGSGKVVVNGGTTVSESIIFLFSGTDNVGVVGFECSIDSLPFTTYVNPQVYTNLSSGPHLFKVRAKDGAGNIDSTPANFFWKIHFPVILLPGILGSWTDSFFEPFVNKNAINQSNFSLTEESQAWFWRQLDRLGFLPHTWEDLKTNLPVLGYKVFKCPYDWRRPITTIARDYLIPCIDKAKHETGGRKIDIIAHSMGGLVARAYIQDDALYRNDVNKFAMVGTPNHGSAKAYFAWEGGELTNGWFGILGSVIEKTIGNSLLRIGVHAARV